ncbi:hypothetical protein EDC56_0213 [Sinobacterium caligoides]|uniref:Cytochrome P450 n=1 Tax=Sinobacterium caligoides TaxID=933926 RepID=A0A3N2DXV8_9GAMM|nr:cytochrome P450 [Sinobacterium caligoides]ROS04700.1 hypothetical protein EDC56_0213 [Sinobacterium caligoides]
MSKYIDLLDVEALPRRKAIFAKMRNEDPIYYFDTEIFKTWFVTDYDNVSRLLHDKRLSNSNTINHLNEAPPEEQEALSSLRRYMEKSLPEASDQRHKVIQSFFLQYFSPKVISGLRSKIELLVDELISDLDVYSEINFSKEFCFTLPIMVIAEILGVPKTDLEKIYSWSRDLIAVFHPYDYRGYLTGQKAMLAMVDYCKGLMLSGDLSAGCLLAALKCEIDSGSISEEEALVNCANILFAGHETTASVLAKGLLMFSKNPEQWYLLRQDSSLMPGAIEELMRTCGLGWLMRSAKVGFEFNGHYFNKGDRVILSPGIANHDEKYFHQPEVFNIKRASEVQHLSFGKGKHYCLGASLARLELEVAFGKILQSFPDMKIDHQGVEIGVVLFLQYAGIYNLPVTLCPDNNS